MSLDPSYLDYPKRGYGQDMDRYDWALAKDRAPVHLASGAKIAAMIVVACEYHPIDPKKAPFNHPHGMITPFPDLRHFTSRDYGNRVGVFRILAALREAGLSATFALSAALLERARPLADAILNDGHEIAAAGLHGDALHHAGLSEDEERALIARTREAFAAAGIEPVTWLSPARQQSFATPDLLTEAGFTRVLDWESDQIPLPLRTSHGPLSALPLLNELEDFKLLVERKQDEASWVRQILEAKDYLKTEYAARGASVLGFQLTPFVAGQPFRITALEALLAGLAQDTDVWCAGADVIASAFER
ncbi:polysaccharide deacetylase family protein [Alkalicaulis satelles]|uniref:Chitooligosaccharide deacetylase n=1 Tax=Alkalicaulis satelles TaxID=2609175 RepID=A0A5M6ZA53_9PROT|nr:polysaccharide deacetylase family protein [Alkalicaulis satelles]KAA5801579.1 polysaccharide deacetylase family protein [Alkalicaulis satelles]